MSAAHTPGPWHWTEADDSREEHPALMGPDAAHICNFGCWTQFYPADGTPPSDSDARLIATAPELLAFVQRLIRVGQFFPSCIELDNYSQDGADGNDLQQEAIALIVKATGSAT